MALEAWVTIFQIFDEFLDDYTRIFDAWEDGGVRGLVIGWTSFQNAEGNFTVPGFPPNPKVYRDRGLEPNDREVKTDPAKYERFLALLDDAKARGWPILIFSPRGGTGAKPLPLEEDPYGAKTQAGVWEEVFDAFPQADGGIHDGWGESPYELRFHHGSAVFQDIPDAAKIEASARGYDAARLERGMLHLRRRFHTFTPAEVRYYGACGVLAELNLFDINEDALYWLRWRRKKGLENGRAFRVEIDKSPRQIKIANGPRSAMFSGMTAYDFHAWDEIVDFLLAKHYFWHRGFDGLYGTVARWVAGVHAWNPSLTEEDCFTVVKAWLGADLPEVHSLEDMDLGLPQAFFDKVVKEETARALAAVSDPDKILPWVDTGPTPHGGDPMPSGDLYRILKASKEAGLRHFVYIGEFTAAEWRVMSRICGKLWNEDPQGYWPAGTPKPSSY